MTVIAIRFLIGIYENTCLLVSIFATHFNTKKYFRYFPSIMQTILYYWKLKWKRKKKKFILGDIKILQSSTKIFFVLLSRYFSFPDSFSPFISIHLIYFLQHISSSLFLRFSLQIYPVFLPTYPHNYLYRFNFLFFINYIHIRIFMYAFMWRECFMISYLFEFFVSTYIVKLIDTLDMLMFITCEK